MNLRLNSLYSADGGVGGMSSYGSCSGGAEIGSVCYGLAPGDHGWVGPPRGRSDAVQLALVADCPPPRPQTPAG